MSVHDWIIINCKWSKLILLIIIFKQEEATEERCCCNHSSTISMLHKTVTVVLVKQHVVAVWKLDVRTYTALHHSPFKYEAPAHTRGNNAAKINKRKTLWQPLFLLGNLFKPRDKTEKRQGEKPQGPSFQPFLPPRGCLTRKHHRVFTVLNTSCVGVRGLNSPNKYKAKKEEKIKEK